MPAHAVPKSDTHNNLGNWNHLKIIQNVPGKYEFKELQKTATYFGKY
jgi:hypothetical protein